jgi:hypothetical protein
MFSKALANSKGLKLFVVDASFFTSGNPTKQCERITALWAVCRAVGPSVVLVDECDGCFKNSNNATRISHIKTTWQTDAPPPAVLILGATNNPGAIDDGIMSRFGERVNFSLPDETARISIWKRSIVKARMTHSFSDAVFTALAAASDGWSGRDIWLCVEAVAKRKNRLYREAGGEGPKPPLTTVDLEERLTAVDLQRFDQASPLAFREKRQAERAAKKAKEDLLAAQEAAKQAAELAARVAPGTEAEAELVALMEKPTIVTPPVTPPMTPPATPPPQIPRPVSGGGSGSGVGRRTGQLLRETAVIETIASKCRGCLVSMETASPEATKKLVKFTSQLSKQVLHNGLRQLAFTEKSQREVFDGRADRTVFTLNDGWSIMIGHNAWGTYGDGSFASGSVKSMQKLLGLAFVNRLMHAMNTRTEMDKTVLQMKEVGLITVPFMDTPEPTHKLTYFLVSDILFDDAIKIAQSPNVYARLGEAVELTREDRIERLVAASAVADRVYEITGIQLPDMSNILDESSTRLNGSMHFNAIIGSVLDAFDAISELVSAPGAQSTQRAKDSVDRISISYRAMQADDVVVDGASSD